MGLCARERSPSAQLINGKIFSGANELAWVRLTCSKEGRDLLTHSRWKAKEKRSGFKDLGPFFTAPIPQKRFKK